MRRAAVDPIKVADPAAAAVVQAAPPFQPLTEVNFPLQVTTSPFANPLAGVTGTPGFPAGLIFIGWGTAFGFLVSTGNRARSRHGGT